MEWELASPGGSCSECGRSFDDRQDYWSAIFPAEDGFSRRDYCADCWRGPVDGMFSFWRTQCRREPAPPKRFVNNEVILEFFERLCEGADPSRAKLRFIMAVLLLRKRLLKEKSRRRDEKGVFWVVECPALGKSFEVRDEGLTEEEVADVLHEIGSVLNVRVDETHETDAAGEANPV